MPLLGFPVFCVSSSIVLNHYFHILVNSMTIWSVLKLPKIAWPSPFKKQFSKTLTQNKRRSNSGKRPNANMLISSFLSIKWHTSCYRTFGEEHLANIKVFTQKILASQLDAVCEGVSVTVSHEREHTEVMVKKCLFWPYTRYVCVEVHVSQFPLPPLTGSQIVASHFGNYYEICWWWYASSRTSDW